MAESLKDELKKYGTRDPQYCCVWCDSRFISSDMLLYHIHIRHNEYLQRMSTDNQMLKKENKMLKDKISSLEKEQKEQIDKFLEDDVKKQ